jgi:hypothetical protein
MRNVMREFLGVAAQRRMDAGIGAAEPESSLGGRRFAGGEGALLAERGPGGDEDDVMSGERELRCATQAEHGEPMIGGDEAHGEHAAGDRARLSSRPPVVDLLGSAEPHVCGLSVSYQSANDRICRSMVLRGMVVGEGDLPGDAEQGAEHLGSLPRRQIDPPSVSGLGSSLAEDALLGRPVVLAHRKDVQDVERLAPARVRAGSGGGASLRAS